jgi:hypothetical protein
VKTVFLYPKPFSGKLRKTLLKNGKSQFPDKPLQKFYRPARFLIALYEQNKPVKTVCLHLTLFSGKTLLKNGKSQFPDKPLKKILKGFSGVFRKTVWDKDKRFSQVCSAH